MHPNRRRFLEERTRAANRQCIAYAEADTESFVMGAMEWATRSNQMSDRSLRYILWSAITHRFGKGSH